MVALVFLASQGAGAIMAHSYYERETFYGIQLNYILPFNFLRSFHLQAPIIWIGLGWIASGLFIAPAIAGGARQRARGCWSTCCSGSRCSSSRQRPGNVSGIKES